jgi:3-oxoacyl-[acyl-carrier protein] reductase
MQNVIVTGTTGDLGGSIAALLLSEGYRVIGVARRHQVAKQLEIHPNYTHKCFDLSDLKGIPKLVSEVVNDCGPIYGLVNNSALGFDGILPTMHAKDIQSLITVNLNAPIELTKYVIRSMLLAREGRVVNISSVVARTGYKGLSVYAATKSGLEGFSKSLAREVGRRGITVNNVAPGFMHTDMTARMTEDQINQIRRRTPLGRLVTCDEVSDTVAFLLSRKASGITGQTLTVDAGASA